MNIIPMSEGWHGLWYRIDAQGKNAWDTYLDLFKRYAQPHRYYHAFKHIMDMLKEFEQAKKLCTNPNAVEMAIWYHDAVYDPDASDNEEKSAELAKRVLDQARLPQIFIDEVVRLILLTKKHITTQDDRDGSVLIDIDLSILGQSDKIFDEYERDIWKEYVREAGMSEGTFASGRVRILNEFINRKPIYQNTYFKRKYEISARTNLKRSLNKLSAKA